MKLNLGSNDQIIEDFKNVDHRALKNVDIVDDAFLLSTIKENSIEEILASHILEHACFDRTEDTLRRWRKVLAPGGRLWVAVPNFKLVFTEHLDNYRAGEISWEYFNSRIFGNAKVARNMYGEETLEEMDGIYKYEMAFHRAVFTEDMLKGMMEKSGFKKVKIINNIPLKGKRSHKHEICCVGVKA